MIPRDVKSPTAPVPFGKLLKVVAIVDPNGVVQERMNGRIKFHTYVVRE
jgi:ornithine decarboxylase